MITDKVNDFLLKFFKLLDSTGIDYSNFKLDHIAYKTSSQEDYREIANKFAKNNKLISEDIFGGIHVSVYKIPKLIEFKTYKIDLVEIIEPKSGEIYPSGFEHVEFLANISLVELMNLYPSLNWDASSINREELPTLKLRLVPCPVGLPLWYLSEKSAKKP